MKKVTKRMKSILAHYSLIIKEEEMSFLAHFYMAIKEIKGNPAHRFPRLSFTDAMFGSIPVKMMHIEIGEPPPISSCRRNVRTGPLAMFPCLLHLP